MKKPDITDLRAEHTGMGLCVMWNGQGYRHHFWLNDMREAASRHAAFTVYKEVTKEHFDVLKQYLAAL